MITLTVKGRDVPVLIKIDPVTRRYNISAVGFPFTGQGPTFEAAINDFMNSASTSFSTFGSPL